MARHLFTNFNDDFIIFIIVKNIYIIIDFVSIFEKNSFSKSNLNILYNLNLIFLIFFI